MEMLKMSWYGAGADGDGTARRGLRLWSGLLAVAAGVALLGLLLAYLTVLRDGVQSGQARRVAVALQAQALQRCTALRSGRLREACRLQPPPAVGDRYMPFPPP
jgi:hypothetical protein